MTHRVRSEIYHHGFAPNRDVVERRGSSVYRFATDSLGFKDASPRQVPLDGGKTRLLMIGDSFAEGPGYPFPETAAGLLDAGLEKAGIEVLNASVGSYAPAVYDRKIRYMIETVGLRVDHVIVFLDISDILDEAEDYPLDASGQLLVPPDDPPSVFTRAGHLLRDNSVLVRLIVLGTEQLSSFRREVKGRLEVARAQNISLFKVSRDELWMNAVTHLRASEWTYDDKAWTDYGERGRARAEQDMTHLREFLDQRGIGMTLVVYPWPDQMEFDPKAPKHRDFWRDWAAAHDTAFVDLFDDFTAGDPMETLKRDFIPGDFHWNAEGNALVARRVLARFLGPVEAH